MPVPFDKLVVLDTETVADASLLPADWPEGKFPSRPIWNRIVCISVLEASIERSHDTDRERYIVTSCRSGGEADWSERQLLQAFWRAFASSKTQLITFSGRSFDVPVILARTLFHSLTAEFWFKSGSKWESYLSRYADWHIDVLDQLSHFGACTKISLGDLARALRLPPKAGHGSEVASMSMEDVRHYCQVDTVLTFIAFARWALLTGRTDEEGHAATLDSLISYLEAERCSRPHLGDFLDAWRAADPTLFGATTLSE